MLADRNIALPDPEKLADNRPAGSGPYESRSRSPVVHLGFVGVRNVENLEFGVWSLHDNHEMVNEREKVWVV